MATRKASPKSNSDAQQRCLDVIQQRAVLHQRPCPGYDLPRRRKDGAVASRDDQPPGRDQKCDQEYRRRDPCQLAVDFPHPLPQRPCQSGTRAEPRSGHLPDCRWNPRVLRHHRWVSQPRNGRRPSVGTHFFARRADSVVGGQQGSNVPTIRWAQSALANARREANHAALISLRQRHRSRSHPGTGARSTITFSPPLGCAVH